MATKYLEEFYAVTLSSVYRVTITQPPKLLKISNRSKESLVSIGKEISDGPMLAICQRLIFFVPEGGGYLGKYEREVIKVNVRYWGTSTSDIIALFLREKDALNCGLTADAVACDPRWLNHTVEVLRTIGPEHPYCSISTINLKTNRNDPLLPAVAWQAQG